jgi:hypothetical protein
MAEYEVFEELTLSRASLATIKTADEIIAEYSASGDRLTLRQLYYQFVSRGLIENSERSYKNLGVTVTNGRIAGLLPWDAIEDRGRSHFRIDPMEDEAEAVNGVENAITYDLWQRQGIYIECWVEKEALTAVISRACDQFRIPYMACKGHLSTSEMYSAGKRFEVQYADGMRCYLLHLGDHDPSGMQMTEDNENRLAMYARTDEIEIRRLALNMDQVRRYNPPPNPAKISDPRAADYIQQYGSESWELDALEPAVIRQLITDEARKLIDPELWNTTMAEESDAMQRLAKLHPNWQTVAEFLDTLE